MSATIRKPVLSTATMRNWWLDAIVFLFAFLSMISGVYFLFLPTGGYQGGRNPGWDPGFLFARTTWDLIHTWAGVALVAATILHLSIHWRWVTKVTANENWFWANASRCR